MTLKENRTSGEWEQRKLCIGNSQSCPGADNIVRFVHAFGEDDGGEIYLVGSSLPFSDQATGIIYQIADPTRYLNIVTCKKEFWSYIFRVKSL